MRTLTLSVLCLLLVGCGKAIDHSTPVESTFGPAARSEGVSETSPGAAELASVVVAVDRKIIYTARVEVQVERFDDVVQQIQKIVASHGGYVARSQIHGIPGRPRQGNWTVRVPVDRYDAFLSAAQRLGEERSVTTDSQDVSEEYFDVEARIRNKKQAEERLLEHLKETTAKLDDILSVERELARVREEIERMEGRLRHLKDRTSLATVELAVDEVGHYEPQELPTYATRLQRAWRASIDLVVTVSQGVLLAAVFLAPWLAILLVGGIVIRVLWRMRRPQKPVEAKAVD